jgi:hypothetical protein
MTSESIAHRSETLAPAQLHCPASCSLPDMVQCWRDLERQLRVDLMAATMSRSPDAEVLRADVRAVERRIGALLAVAFGWAA